MKSLHLLILTILLCSLAASAQSTLESKVDAVVQREMVSQKVPGVSVAVVKDGKPVVVKGYGLANLEHNVPVKPETIFQSGSIGKQFTAFAVMLLVDEGKTRLDEKIGTYLGDVPESWSKITVRQLLTHTGGLTDYPDDFNFRRDYTEDELLDIAKKIPTAFPPGERWQYSNLGYVTLGIMIHKVSGKFYGDFLKERVFGPLGMETARVINEADIIPNRSAGYRVEDGQWKNQRWVAPSLNTTADGSLYLTVLDMIKWDAALRERKLLSARGYEQMWSPVNLNSGRKFPYGFGWAVKEVNGRALVEHGGSWQGFKSFIARYTDDGLTVIVFGNCASMNPTKFAHGIAEAIDPGLKQKPIDDPEPAVSAKIRKVFENAVAKKVDRDLFSEDLGEWLAGGKDGLLRYAAVLGPVKNFLLMGREKSAEGATYKYRIEYADVDFLLTVEMGEDGKISVFDLDID